MHTGNLSDIVQFRFALTENGTLVDANVLGSKDRKDYKCLGCSGKVRPVLGQIRKKHFRHTHNQSCCSETYLHNLGKRLFESNYRHCLKEGTPYFIEYMKPIVCKGCKEGPCSQYLPKIHKYDITELFTSVDIEQPDGNYKPDILLKTKKGHKIYVEICVTHKATHEKINTRIKIIEFIINNENDLDIFKKNLVSISDKLIKLYNFNPPAMYVNFYDECCRAKEISDAQIQDQILLNREKHKYKPFIIPDSIICSMCGKASSTWVSFNPNKCRECLKKLYNGG